MKRSSLPAVLGIALLSACSMNGVRTEDGKINLGPNAFGDDPIYHRPYADYAEYAVATGELREMEQDGFSKKQQLCFAHAMLDNLPPALTVRLNEYATGEKILMESEYAALSKEVGKVAQSKSVLMATWSDFKVNCKEA